MKPCIHDGKEQGLTIQTAFGYPGPVVCDILALPLSSSKTPPHCEAASKI